MPHFMISSRLPLSPDDFWHRQSLDSVNAELGPWLRMTAPAHWHGVRLQDWDGQGPLFSSWVLLLGLLPIDRHRFGRFAFEPGSGFVETSSSWNARQWRHERRITAGAGGCTLTDRIDYTARWSVMTPLLGAIYRSVFRHRHRRLNTLYGSVS